MRLLLPLLTASTLAGEPPILDTWSLVRVDDPDHPGALAVSAHGAVLAVPPAPGTPWRREPVAEPDAYALEAVAVTNADRWHADGFGGQGVRVAVFDSGWFAGEARPEVLGDTPTHDCWAHPSCALPIDPYRPRLSNEGNAHGWACAEVVRSVAPDVELHLVAVPTWTAFENAVDWAIREGIDVVSMSLSFYNASFYDGRGPFDAPMRRLEAAGVLMVTSAGNDARAHWRGRFVDADLDGRMDFDGRNGLDVWLEAGSRSVYVNWNEHGRCGETDLDARVVDAAGRIVGRAEARQLPGADRCEPIEVVTAWAPEPAWYRVEVWRHRGVASALEVDLIGRAGVVFDASDPAGSVTDPASHPLALAVGAVRAEGYLTNDAEPFSSRGPTSAGLPKPDIAGPDGVSTWSFGPVGFFGTSASTPAVAGLVAVLMSEDPGLTSRAAAERLQAHAWSDGVDLAGPDMRFGAGKARLPVRDPGDPGCGSRPLVAAWPLLLLGWPFGGRRRPPGAPGSGWASGREDRSDPSLRSTPAP